MDVQDTDRQPWVYWANQQADRLEDLGFTDQWEEKILNKSGER